MSACDQRAGPYRCVLEDDGHDQHRSATGVRWRTTRDRVEMLARWLWEHDAEGAFTWESTADEWRAQARELIAFLEALGWVK